MQAVVLAAGKGSRLHPITVGRSKAMLPVLGQPMVRRVMETLRAGAPGGFVLVVSPEDREIVEYFEGDPDLGPRVKFVEQPERLGMAEALSRAAPFLEGDFLLSACDNLVAPEVVAGMLALWGEEPRPNAVLALMEVAPEQAASVGIVALQGEWVTRIVEKPAPGEAPGATASMPLYLFSRRLLDYLPEVPRSPRGEYELQDAIQMLIEREGRVRGCRAPGRLTLTTPADLLALNRRFLEDGGAQHHPAPRGVGAGTRLFPPLYVEAGALIGAGCAIGPHVYIERDCRVGDGAAVREAVLLRGASVPPGARVQGQVVS